MKLRTTTTVRPAPGRVGLLLIPRVLPLVLSVVLPLGSLLLAATPAQAAFGTQQAPGSHVAGTLDRAGTLGRAGHPGAADDRPAGRHRHEHRQQHRHRHRHRHHGGGRRLPSAAAWHRDVARALAGVPAYLQQRATDDRLAIVLGIDNVALATHYDWPRPVREVLRVERLAHRLGYAVFFVTGRVTGQVRRVLRPLRRAGFVWDGVCARAHGARIAPAKLRCRRAITDAGYTITANISAHDEAYVGGYFERAFLLPSYGGRLG